MVHAALPRVTLDRQPGALAPDLAGAIARAGVDPTLDGRALQDALRRAIAVRRGYCSWDVDHAGWVRGAWCEPADLDRLFRLWATRRLNRGGSVRFRHWRLYGERGLAGERAAVWDGTLTIEHAVETLAQDRWRLIVPVAGAQMVHARRGSSQERAPDLRGANRLAGQVGEAGEQPFSRQARAHREEGL